MKVLITGGCGFLGSNLANSYLKDEAEITIIDGLFRKGSEENLEWIKQKSNKHQLNFFKGDISDSDFIENIFTKHKKFDYVCHVAGQVAMIDSIIDPLRDLKSNLIGTFNILEAVRKFCPDSLLAFSSTNKVYGDLEWIRKNEIKKRYILPDYPNGLDESLPLDFSTPYGCSKGAADQYVRDWSRVFGLKTVIFRHSSIYGGRQFASENQGWIGWFIEKMLEQEICFKKKLPIKEFTISGNGKQVRDVLHSDDLISLYKYAYKYKDVMNGEIFNIGGGLNNSLSILELIDLIKSMKKTCEPKISFLERRESDQDCFIADISKAKNILNWEPKISKEIGITKMINWISSNMKLSN